MTERREGKQQISREAKSFKWLGMICGLVVAGLLVAGLWPFHSPQNDVAWSSTGSGLVFGRHGTILSSGMMKVTPGQENSPCSIELWVEPSATDDSGTLLTFYEPGRSRLFSLQQSISDLAVRSDIHVPRARNRTVRFYVGDIFRRGKGIFITITSGQGKTLAYINGVYVEAAPGFPLAAKDLEGELIIANWPTHDDSWSGVVRGLAIYEQELSPVQVRRHYATWTGTGRPEVAADERPAAIYLFDEHAGRAVHNHVPSDVALYIPERYAVVHEVFFQPAWDEFHPSWSYVQDVLINIAGFIPLGFLCFPYFALARRAERPLLVTVLLGFAISLTIEYFQGFLPTRNSGTTDLITNTSGTAIGVWLFRTRFWRIFFASIWASLFGVSKHVFETD